MPPVQEDEATSSDAAIRWRSAAPDLPPFPGSRPPVEAPPPVEYAGYLVRAIALAIDVGVLGAFAIPLALAGLFGIRAGMMALGQPVSTVGAAEIMTTLVSPAWAAMAVAYFTAMHRGDGRTIGKAVLGIRVRSLDLGAIGVIRSLIRVLAYAPSSMFLGFGFLMAAFTPRKRAAHDYIAGTCVVRLAPGEA
jgi:uncharacterized RDD family membrane protein YckC